MSRRASRVDLSPRQRALLARLSRSRTLPRRLAERVAFILAAATGSTCVADARRMGVDAQRPRRWRKRWHEAQPRLAEAEAKQVSDDELESLVLEVLSDEERSGAPPKFSADQISLIITLALKSPKECGLPVTHWTAEELAREAVKAEIVESISARHIARLL